MSRQRIRWITLTDGPMAGQRVSAGIVQAGTNVLRVSRGVADRPFEAEVHEYKLAGTGNQIRAMADSQREAWRRAFEQAESIGLAGREFY